MINWIEITQDNYMRCISIYDKDTRGYLSSNEYVYLNEKKEITLSFNIYFTEACEIVEPSNNVTHFALRSEYEAILPNAQKHDELPIIPVHDERELA